ncbi:hypothetical protein Bbelb_329020 [Branchiostoma belcheri]|nr:hypothetical protein Bbelb_329020 [Branchiostoma belcheri]
MALAGPLLVFLQCACVQGSGRRLCGSALPREIRVVCAVNKRSVSSGEEGTSVARGNEGSQSSSTLLRFLAGKVGTPPSSLKPKSATMQVYDKLHIPSKSRGSVSLYIDDTNAGTVQHDVIGRGSLNRSPRRRRREEWRGLAYHCCIVGCDVEDLALAC